MTWPKLKTMYVAMRIMTLKKNLNFQHDLVIGVTLVSFQHTPNNILPSNSVYSQGSYLFLQIRLTWLCTRTTGCRTFMIWDLTTMATVTHLTQMTHSLGVSNPGCLSTWDITGLSTTTTESCSSNSLWYQYYYQILLIHFSFWKVPKYKEELITFRNIC